MIDVAMLRLQYEILGVPAQSIAEANGIPLDMLEDEIRRKNWTVLWGTEPSPATLGLDPEDETFTSEADLYIEQLRKRLAAFSLAKDALLASRYLELEAGIIAKACEALTHIDPTAVNAIKALAALYKDMTKNLASAASLAMTTDESGIPTVIIKDLSGRA